MFHAANVADFMLGSVILIPSYLARHKKNRERALGF